MPTIAPTDSATLARRVVAYMRFKGYTLDRGPGEMNIAYVEGMNPAGTLNNDAFDRWNDLRLLIRFEHGQPKIVHGGVATTEPGRRATMDAAAAKRGGVARINFGQYAAWQVGFHKRAKYGTRFPALVQVAPVAVCRDFNRDGKRTGDKVTSGLFGINQHGTDWDYVDGPLGNWSEGCMVERGHVSHVVFMELCKIDPRYLKDTGFLFKTAITPGDEMLRLFPTLDVPDLLTLGAVFRRLGVVVYAEKTGVSFRMGTITYQVVRTPLGFNLSAQAFNRTQTVHRLDTAQQIFNHFYA